MSLPIVLKRYEEGNIALAILLDISPDYLHYLQEQFEASGFGWDNAVEILLGLSSDSNAFIDGSRAAEYAMGYLNNCWHFTKLEKPRSTYEAWREPAMLREMSRRKTINSRKPPTPVTWWETAFAGWLMHGKTSVEIGFRFAKQLQAKGLNPEEAGTLFWILRGCLSEAEQAKAVIMVCDNLFFTEELKNPAKVILHFHEASMDKPVTSPESSRKATTTLAASSTTALPMAIKKAKDDVIENLKEVLPGKLKSHAANFAIALKVLKDDPLVPLDPKVLAQSVERQRRSANVKFPLDIILRGLPLLAKNGLLRYENGRAQHLPVTTP